MTQQNVDSRTVVSCQKKKLCCGQRETNKPYREQYLPQHFHCCYCFSPCTTCCLWHKWHNKAKYKRKQRVNFGSLELFGLLWSKTLDTRFNFPCESQSPGSAMAVIFTLAKVIRNLRSIREISINSNMYTKSNKCQRNRNTTTNNWTGSFHRGNEEKYSSCCTDGLACSTAN